MRRLKDLCTFTDAATRDVRLQDLRLSSVFGDRGSRNLFRRAPSSEHSLGLQICATAAFNSLERLRDRIGGPSQGFFSSPIGAITSQREIGHSADAPGPSAS
jgi:hypothetical protein